MRNEGISLILHGGRVRTMDAAGTMAAAIAVKGDRIAALGGDREVLALRDPGRRVIDLRGRTVVPGFIDAHTHPASAGLRHVECNLDRFFRDRKSTRLNSSHIQKSRMPSSA